MLMDLIAGDPREILLALAMDEDLDGVEAFGAHLPLGGGLDPAWLDQFALAVRFVTRSRQPGDFEAARWPLEDRSSARARNVDRIDPGWIAAVAAVADPDLDAVAARWLDLMAGRVGPLDGEDRAAFRELTDQLVRFARSASLEPAVLLAWSI